MAALIDKAPSSQAGLVQRTRMVLVALTLAIGVSFLAGPRGCIQRGSPLEQQGGQLKVSACA
jgi:hypothetical protein